MKGLLGADGVYQRQKFCGKVLKDQWKERMKGKVLGGELYADGWEDDENK